MVRNVYMSVLVLQTTEKKTVKIDADFFVCLTGRGMHI